MKIITIGRGSNNDIIIKDDNSVSRTHCQIIQDDNGSFTLVDTGSLNGTYINGSRLHGEARINTSDIVRIGNTTLPWQTYFIMPDSDKTVAFNINLESGFVDADSVDYNGANLGHGESAIGNNNSIHINNVIDDKGTKSPSVPKPSNFLAWAILSTIFCCVPFGIASIVQASKVDELWAAGKYDEAQEAASKARTWFWWALGVGFSLWMVCILATIALIV